MGSDGGTHAKFSTGSDPNDRDHESVADLGTGLLRICPNSSAAADLRPPLISLAEARAIIDGAVLALWLAGRDVNELESTRMKLDRELDEALEETFSASDPPSITREP